MSYSTKQYYTQISTISHPGNYHDQTGIHMSDSKKTKQLLKNQNTVKLRSKEFMLQKQLTYININRQFIDIHTMQLVLF
jgi:hypothetical protein